MTYEATLQFLKKILPAEGFLCVHTLPNKRHFWTESVEVLAQKILELDAQNDGSCLSVYHACASYETRDNRKQKNVLSVKSFWLDIDVKEHNPNNARYSTVQEAVTAIQRFVKEANLPEPMYVSSGWGIHLYWPLIEALPEKEWKVYAKGLKELCEHHRFRADPVRTTDSASILRPIGTANRKHAVSFPSVELVKDCELYDIARFSHLRAKTLAAKSDTPKNDEPAYAVQIVQQCAQIRFFRDQAGFMPEPDWKACLGVLAFCADGFSLGHEWSKGDERYSFDETQAKLEASRELTGPITCAHFSSLNDRCSACPHKGQITTPLQLGKGEARLSPEQVVAAEKFNTEETSLPKIGAFRHRNGSLVFEFRKNGEDESVLISQYPIVVEAVARGEMNADTYSLVIRHKPPQDTWQSTSISVKTLFGASGLAEIMGRGIVIHNDKLFKQYVRESMDRLNAAKRAQMQYDQYGWKDDDSAFLIGRRLYTKDAVIESSGGTEVTRRSKGIGPQPRGSFEIWKNNVDMLFASGFEAQGFAVLASFSAPFMKWQAHSEGGCIVSLISRQGGKGKSTALTAAASVWGRLEAMKQTNSDTRVAKGIVLGVMGNLPVIRDEYTQRDPEVLREEVQIFTEGRDKQRGSAEGTLVNMGSSWQTVMIAGSNTSLVDTLRAAKNGAAMAERVIELTVDIPKDTAHWRGDQLKDEINNNSGYAGEMFIRSVLQPENMPYLKAMVSKMREDIIKSHNLTSEKRFMARTLAGVATAGFAVRHLGLLDMSADRIMEWAQDCLMKDYRNKVPDEPSYMLARFLSENINHTLVVQDEFRPRTPLMPIPPIPTHRIYIRREINPGRMYIDLKALRKWMQQEEQPWADLLNDLDSKGILVNSSKLMTLGAGTTYTTGRAPCLVVDTNNPHMTGIVAEVSTKEKVA